MNKKNNFVKVINEKTFKNCDFVKILLMILVLLYYSIALSITIWIF